MREIERDTHESATQLVDEAVSHIYGILAQTIYRGAVEVGEYVFERFFGADPAFARSRDPRKSASFRLLAARCGTPGLPISSTWLYNAVAIAMLRRSLPVEAAFLRLPFSHQTTLLVLREPARIEQVACRAVEEGLSVRQLRHAVREQIAQPHGRRRPESTLGLPVTTILEEMLGLLSRGRVSLSMDTLERLSTADAQYADEAVRRLVSALTQLQEKLELLAIGPHHRSSGAGRASSRPGGTGT